MANKITTLIDSTNNDQLYPRTKASAVSDNVGNSLENLLIYSGNSIEETTDPTIVASLSEATSVSKNGYFIYDNGTNVYKVKASTLFPNPSVNGWYMGQYMRGWELHLILPCNGDIWGNPVIVGTPRAYVDGTAQGWYDLPTDSSWSRGNYHNHWKLSLADNLVPEDIRAVRHTNAILQIRVVFS